MLTVWALALVAATVAATAALAYRQLTGLAREEALARAARAGDRALEAMSRGLDPALFEQETGVEVTRRARAEVESSFGEARLVVWREALEKGHAERFLSGGAGAVAALALPGAPSPGVVEARIPEERVLAAPRRFLARLLVAAGAIAVAALALAWILARRFAAPIEESGTRGEPNGERRSRRAGERIGGRRDRRAGERARRHAARAAADSW